MTGDNRNVTRLKVSREEWLKIESGETSFILSEDEPSYEQVAIVFVDALTGTHLGNAIIVSESTFGGWESTPWTWSMFAKLTGMTERELKERFPAEAKMKNPSACEMYLCEIKPVDNSELLQRLCGEQGE
jgi:hypothetical protein